VRRLSGIVIVAALVATGMTTLTQAATAAAAPASAPAAQVPTGDAALARGLVMKGLRKAVAGSHCGLDYQLELTGLCTHGPDPAPPNIDVRYRRGTPVVAPDTASPSGTTAASTPNVPCYGDGTSGDRVQAVYAHAADVSDRYAALLPSVRQWAADADDVFNQSAAETGGIRHIRFVTDSSCNISVIDIQLSTTGDDSIDNTISELQHLGYNRPDRKYLVWMDANVYCGIAQVFSDDSSGQNNLSNGNGAVAGEVARVDSACWGLSSSNQSIEAHELMHALGGVQTSAPHATKYSHCWDESDRMCYQDGSGSTMQQICPSSHENRFDCNHDDYYSTNPPPGSYLATHWNTANSSFLATADGSPAPPTTNALPANSQFTPLPPARLLDTRNGTGGFSSPVGPGQSINVQVTGVGGVPQSGVAAVALNVTAVDPSDVSYLTVYPTGGAVPTASNLNVGPGETVPNLVIGKVGSGGKVSVYNAVGTTDVVFDVAGWYAG
jgi:hypothetical protein